jgi:hypothetical protein
MLAFVMMFVGAIPRECVEQSFRLVDMAKVDQAYVCCSGSFRFEQAVNASYPDVLVHSNDVSVLSTAIGRFAVGDPLPIKFTGRLSFLERTLCKVGDTPVLRLGAIGLALQLCHFQLGPRTLKSMTDLQKAGSYMEAHFQHIITNSDRYVLEVAAKLSSYIDNLKISSYYCGDFRDHARDAIKMGAHIFAWPPTYRGGYEKLYKLIDNNTEWCPPEYGIWGPDSLGDWLTELKEANARFVVCSDRDLRQDGHDCHAMYLAGGERKMVYLYSSVANSTSYRFRPSLKSGTRSFRYELLDPADLHPDSTIKTISVDRKQMNFIKNKYLKIGLWHGSGQYDYLVFIDDKLAGGFVFDKPGKAIRKMKYPNVGHLKTIYLLCDFSTSRLCRLSKLIAMLTTVRENINPYDLRKICRTSTITTTVFSNNPKSMKYRGVYDFYARNPAKTCDPSKYVLTYVSKVRDASNQEIYKEWWRRWGRKAVTAERLQRGQAQDPHSAG